MVPIKLTETAISEIINTVEHKNIPSEYGLRVGTKSAGCGVLSYELGFDLKKEDDEEYLINGIKVYIEKRNIMYLIGYTIDFYEGNDARGFTFVKPGEE